MVDAPDSKSGMVKHVWVQVPPLAPVLKLRKLYPTRWKFVKYKKIRGLYMEFKKLQDGVSYAVENDYGYIVQRYFDTKEYTGDTESTSYDVDNVENCEYDFFFSHNDAEKFRMSNVWSSIVGSHQVIIDVQAYLQFYGQQEPVNPKVKMLILKKSEKEVELPF
jgi:hypothetical protein